MTMQRNPLAQIGKKKPKCKICQKSFTRERPGMRMCSVECVIEDAKRKEVARRCAPYRDKPVRNTKERKAFLANDKKYVARQAKAYCHRYIKARDQGQVCIACQQPMDHLPQSAIHASHYRASGMNSAIRYHEDNIHLCDSGCNSNQSGNLINYRINLIHKIGIDKVQWLESQNHVKRWTIDELREVRDDYAQRLKQLNIKLPTVN